MGIQAATALPRNRPKGCYCRDAVVIALKLPLCDRAGKYLLRPLSRVETLIAPSRELNRGRAPARSPRHSPQRIKFGIAHA